MQMDQLKVAEPKKARESTSKVRTGCITCKKRRVKCDEAKPFCRRCLSGRRQCEGYTESRPPVSSRTSIVMYLPPTNSGGWAASDWSQLDYYYSKVAYQLSGSWDSDFWNTLIMQLCHTEPAIRHAVNAISRAARNTEDAYAVNVPSLAESREAYALQEYNAALKCLAQRIQQDDISRLVPLVACLLLTCLEFILGTVDSSMVHIQSGLSILESCVSSLDSACASSPEMASIEKHVVPIFSRLNVLCNLFQKCHPNSALACSTGNTHQFSTLSEARNTLYEIMGPAVKFIRQTNEKKYSIGTDMEDVILQYQFQGQLKQWDDCFEELVMRLCASKQPVNKSTINIMRMHHRSISLWLSFCLSLEQCLTDSYTASFEEILTLASKVLSHQRENSNGPDLGYVSFEMQILPPLYYTAIECRVPSIRRRAVDLMRYAPRREGLWDAHVATKFAERVIEIEERNLVFDQSMPNKDTILPLEEDRIHIQSELPGRFVRYLGPHSTSRTEVVFSTKPFGVFGEWQTYVEEIVL